MSKQIHAIPGQRFGEWTVIQEIVVGRWLCRCACGLERAVSATSLRAGDSSACRSCAGRPAHTRHGESHGRGKKGTPEYLAWNSMKQRAGKRSQYLHVQISPQWRGAGGYERFLADVGRMPGPGYELDRIDNVGHYVPGNVRWATHQEQMRNVRYNRLLTVGGRTQCLAAWAEETGLDVTTIRGRLKRGWAAEQAVDPLRRVRLHRRARSMAHVVIAAR